MDYVVSILLSVVSGVLVWVIKGLVTDNKALREANRQAEAKQESAIKDGVLSLLRIQLIEYHDKYMTRESLPAYVLDNWTDLYNSYTALGGNGTIKRMNDDLNKLRVGNGVNKDESN